MAIPVPLRRLCVTTLGVLALGASAATLPAVAHDDDRDKPGKGASVCPPGQERAAERAGDNFDDACLPGNDLAGLDDSDAVLAPGEVDKSDNITLLANLPKSGPFTAESSFQTDLAFQGDYAFQGNYDGLTVYDIRKPHKPRIVTQVLCPGSQNDISVYDDLLVLSVDSSRSNDTCDNEPQSARIKESWEGIRVFDISDPTAPQYVAAVETACGSHTHTLAPSKDGRDVYVYVSSYSPNASFPDCQPPHDQISVVKVPTEAPQDAAVVSEPVLFPAGGNPSGNYSRETSGCHDLTAYPSKDIAAGACMGDGVLIDIADRENPVVTETVRDTENFAFWHSATFNNAGTKVVFTDELGGGGGPTCNPTVGETKGADGIYDIVGGELEFRSYFKIPRTQANTENCVAHNGSLIPVRGRDIMVQAWYQGGISVWDFTDSANPKEIAHFDRGPLSADELILGGSWSAYWYNGHIYSSDIQMGFDVFRLNDPRVARARSVKTDELNVQSQTSY
ncbi:LVIVD repeat-containing protein [Nocardioides sp. SYSU DS0651]|uniref:LVIVD repeat-containing protein n=1 Tax=Nocardioides sp. SYSU DS0651 TaxID=3415955 RepID=UPI003F4BB021